MSDNPRPAWTDEQREAFREAFREARLERHRHEGEAVEFHVPPAMVGILSDATVAEIRERYRRLYADCLGPWLEQLQ